MRATAPDRRIMKLSGFTIFQAAKFCCQRETITVLAVAGLSGAVLICSEVCSLESIMISSFAATSSSAASNKTISDVVIGGEDVSVDEGDDELEIMGTPANMPPLIVTSRVKS